jgi:hypothetical protein
LDVSTALLTPWLALLRAQLKEVGGQSRQRDFYRACTDSRLRRDDACALTPARVAFSFPQCECRFFFYSFYWHASTIQRARSRVVRAVTKRTALAELRGIQRKIVPRERRVTALRPTTLRTVIRCCCVEALVGTAVVQRRNCRFRPASRRRMRVRRAALPRSA